MLSTFSAAGALRGTRPLLAYNKSSGYRWSPIPKPPPPHYDRLYGVHSVLNTLRVAAAASQRQQTPDLTNPSFIEDALAKEKGNTRRKSIFENNVCLSTTTKTDVKNCQTFTVLHPRRAHLSCLYVRDFSAEEEESSQHNDHRDGSSRMRKGSQQPRKKAEKVIPAQYTAVRCIAALAKWLGVPVRFVPRGELVQLCGERRNQNVVLEASSYAPHFIQRLEDIWTSTDEERKKALADGNDSGCEAGPQNSASSTSSSSQRSELILFLEHIIDPTNIGSILRTAFFFGVDHVILSRDCAACTATVSRTSTGFLEHLCVHRATVSTADFLRASRKTYAAQRLNTPMGDCGPLEIIASAVVSGEPAHPSSATMGLKADLDGDVSSSVQKREGTNKDGNHVSALASVRKPAIDSICQPNVRLLLLGNEDAGLPQELLRWCTHVTHVRSPRQLRLRHARKSGNIINTNHNSCTNDWSDSSPRSDNTADEKNLMVHDDVAQSTSANCSSTSQHKLTEVERHELSLQRLARLREKEVSLNVNTATGALLTVLVAVEGKLPDSASFGMVEIQACNL